jgi:hypothetical protein
LEWECNGVYCLHESPSMEDLILIHLFGRWMGFSGGGGGAVDNKMMGQVIVTKTYALPNGLGFRARHKGRHGPSTISTRYIGSKPATGEGMDKSTLVHTQIHIIIIHFLPSPFPPIPNG